MEIKIKFVTLPEAAKVLNIPASTLRRAAKRGAFPTYKTFGNRIRVRLSEIVTAIEGAQNE